MNKNPVLIVLGTIQDGGFPQSGCFDDCCRLIDKNNSQNKFVSSICIVDRDTKSCWLIDITPDFKDQIRLIKVE